MKQLIFILATFLSIHSFGQSLPELIKEYEDDCNEEVLDTIEQTAYLSFGVHELTEQGEWIAKHEKNDTVWSPECPEFKTPPIDEPLVFEGCFPLELRPPWGKRTEATRQIICKCKRKEVRPFGWDFWLWLKEK